MRNLQRFIMCFLMALFGHEVYLVGFCNLEPDKDIAIIALSIGFLLLLERLVISITIEHIQNMVAKAKVRKNDGLE